MSEYTKAVFLSYASQDAEAAQRICDALRAAGVEVWFDRNELRGGDAWDASIRTQIKECALFVPVISSNTNARSEGYFRLEWKLAIDRSHLIADDQVFLLPVVIDDTPETMARVPDRFRERQWSRLVGGEAPAAFAERVKQLLSGSPAPAIAESTAKPVRRSRALIAALIIVAAATVAGFYIFSHRSSSTAPSSSTALPPPPIPEKSIAVLPLVDLSQNKDQEYLCDGFSEELLDSLAKVPGLRVVARTSAFSFKGKNMPVAEIANKLGVANIVEGSLQRDGSRIRVSTQLISARDGFHLWSDTFQRELVDVFAVQDEITHAVVDALKVRLVQPTSVRTETENAAAYDLYLQGLYFSNKSDEQDLRKSLALFQQTLDKDPNFGRAWTGVAKAWLYLADAYVRPLEAYPLVERAADNALQLNERDPEAHCFLGIAKAVLKWDLEQMLKETHRALEIDPNSSLGHVWLGDTFRDRGEFDHALQEYQKALRLDPLSPIVSDALCYGYVYAGRFDDAIAQGKHTLELDPNYVYVDSNLGNAYREKGLLDEAIDVYRAGEQSTHSPSAGLAITYARLGKIKEADQKLAELLAEKDRRYISASNIALVYAALGKKDEAFTWLERAYSEHDAEVRIIAFFPGSQPLRRDPRFIDLVKRVGLDPAKAIPH